MFEIYDILRFVTLCEITDLNKHEKVASRVPCTDRNVVERIAFGRV